MKKFRKTILPVLCLLLLLPILLLTAECSLPAFYGETYYAELPRMVSRLKQAEGRRLILIGGSSVAFGTDTRLLEEMLAEYGYPYTVCPMGLYAAVGTSAMLDLTEPELREGDLVVLALEPTSETMSEYFGATAFWKCAESDPGLLLSLSSSKQSSLAGSYVGYLQERWALRDSGEYPAPTGVYALSSFDDDCNLIYERAGNTMQLGYDLTNPIDLAAVTISEDFAAHVSSFCDKAARVGARVVFTFCPMNRSAMTDDSAETLHTFFTLCCQAFPCTPISDPRQYVLDSGWFYDSNFHLNTAGAQLRTCLLAEDLLAELGCYAPVTSTLPEMPESIAAVMTETAGDDAFLYTLLEDGSAWLVNDLTETGLTAEELTVPSAYEGLPVVGFAPGALDSASHLVQLRLPAAIQQLPDSCFAACTSLQRLILEHTAAPCPIRSHSLDGTSQVRIFVPQSAYHLYRDGTGCQENLWQSYLQQIYTY